MSADWRKRVRRKMLDVDPDHEFVREDWGIRVRRKSDGALSVELYAGKIEAWRASAAKAIKFKK